MRLKDRRAVITGAATGIGRATALSLAKEGATLIVADINVAAGKETVELVRQEGVDAHFHETDVSRSADMKRLMSFAVEAMGGIDIIINNAGVQYSGSISTFPEEKWDHLMRVNPRSCYLGAKYGVPHMRESGGGAIVNISSIAGLKGGPGMTAYAASKGAIVAFTTALAAELAPAGIRVNSVCPGWIDTPFNKPAIEFMGGPAKQEALVESGVPMSRQGTPDEIAPAVVYLVSDDSSYMTGQALIIDGGLI